MPRKTTKSPRQVLAATLRIGEHQRETTMLELADILIAELRRAGYTILPTAAISVLRHDMLNSVKNHLSTITG